MKNFNHLLPIMETPKTVTEQCQKIKKEGRRGIMMHVIVGYPDIATSESIALILLEAGIDFLEIQIPFSDPMADGPTFMHANNVAVKNKTTVQDCFELMRRLQKKTDIPLILMGYYNSIFRKGVREFCEQASQAGCSGIIFPDYPIDHESREWLIATCRDSGLEFIPVLNPSATDERIKKVGQLNPALLYYGIRKGTTGAKETLDVHLQKNIQYVKEFLSCPIAVGWGISTPGHIRDLPREADIAIIGSKTTDIYNVHKSLVDVENYTKSIIKASK